VSGFVAVSMLAAACAEDTATETTDAPAPATTEAAAPATTEGDAPATTEGDAPATTEGDAPETTEADGGEGGDDVNAWALEYTGGTAGAASGDPIKIGYVNQEAVFPEASVGIRAAVDYVNAELGGAGGRPLELVECEVAVEEDGARCGSEFLNDADISFVMTGTLLNGGQGLYDTLDGQKPVIIGNAVTNPDFLTSAGVGYATGSVGVIPGLAQFALTRLDPAPTSAAVVYASNPAGQAAYASLLKPVFDKAGVTVTAVEVTDPGATSADVQSAMIAAGADSADVFIPLVTVQSCIATYDAIKQLGIDPVVVTTGLCFGTPMTDHLASIGDGGQVPEGWYFGGYGYDYFQPDVESGMATYVAKIQEYGVKPASAPTLEYTGFAGPMFANLLTATKFINELGADGVTPEAMRDKIFGFTGPMMIQAGELSCGATTVLGIPFVAVCGNQMGVQQYVDGAWVSAANALNGDPIDVRDI
jgi:branched-chain amino acid transport system substrate-binding protein